MSTFEIRTADPAHPNPQVIADDELDALEQAVAAEVLLDGDEGNVEAIPDPVVEPYEPEEGPG